MNNNQSNQPVKQHKRLKRILIVAGLLVLLASCTFCAWFLAIDPALFRSSLRIYPNAQEISSASGYYGANTGVQTRYFWTSKSLEEVKQYYETFTLPFIQKDYWFTFEIASHHRTVFNPSGALLPVTTDEFSSETLNPTQDYFCHYQMHYQCVEIELLDFGVADTVILRPPPGPMRMIQTPSPVSADLKGGTLIVYIYYVNAF